MHRTSAVAAAASRRTTAYAPTWAGPSSSASSSSWPGDIIATILVDTSIESVAALALVVLIRTFLSFSLETEIEGRFPWRRARETSAGRSG